MPSWIMHYHFTTRDGQKICIVMTRMDLLRILELQRAGMTSEQALQHVYKVNFAELAKN